VIIRVAHNTGWFQALGFNVDVAFGGHVHFEVSPYF
jgi:hypothetical protein